MQLKITACMCNWGKFWTKKIKKDTHTKKTDKNKPIAISEKLGAGM